MADNIIEIDISDEDRKKVIELYIKEKMSEESYLVFVETLHDYDFNKALESAIFNESVINMLQHYVEEKLQQP